MYAIVHLGKGIVRTPCVSFDIADFPGTSPDLVFVSLHKARIPSLT
jgi:hypothetical protein